MEMEVEIWPDQKVEKTKDGARKKNFESFGVTSTKELVKGHLQKKRISVQDNCITGSKDMLKVALKHSKTGKSPAIHLRHCPQANLSPKSSD